MIKTDGRRAWAVLLAATGVQFISGILYIWSIISKELVNRYNWTSTEASLPYMAAAATVSISMVFGGKLQDKKGPRLVTSVGAAMLGLGLFLSGFAKTPIAMAVTFGVFAGAGIGINNVSTIAVALKWFPPTQKGLITGIVVGGVGVASILYSPLINGLIVAFGVFQSFAVLGIAVFVLVVGMAQLVVNPPGMETERAYKPADAGDVNMRWRQMIRTRNFYLLWIMLAFSASAGLMIIAHISSIAKIQAGWEGGYLLVAFLAVFNIAGRLFGGILSDKIGRVHLLRIIFLIQAVNMFFFGFYTSVKVLAMGAAIAGLCYGAIFAVFPAATADMYGIINMGANYGLVSTAWGAGGIIGPLVAGGYLDHTGGYGPSYMVASVLLIAATGASFALKGKTKNFNKKTEACL